MMKIPTWIGARVARKRALPHPILRADQLADLSSEPDPRPGCRSEDDGDSSQAPDSTPNPRRGPRYHPPTPGEMGPTSPPAAGSDDTDVNNLKIVEPAFVGLRRDLKQRLPST